MKKFTTKSMVLCALFIAMAVVLSLFDIPIPFAGATGMRISISGFVSKLPAILYGPLIGGICSGLMDIISHVVKPEGPFMWQLTLTAMSGGVMVGFLSKFLNRVFKDDKSIEKVFLISGCIIGITGAINLMCLSFAPDSVYSQFMLKLGTTSKGVARYDFVTYGLLIVFVVALIAYITNYIYKKKTTQHSHFIVVFTALFISNIIVTTLNTFVLRQLIPSLGGMAFWVYYIPRLVEEVVMTVIQSVGVTYLLNIMRKIKEV